MDTKNNHPACGTPEKNIEWGNSKGIKAPSETAKSLMQSEGYVQPSANDPDAKSTRSETSYQGIGKSMSHVDEGARVTPKQREWPL